MTRWYVASFADGDTDSTRSIAASPRSAAAATEPIRGNSACASISVSSNIGRSSTPRRRTTRTGALADRNRRLGPLRRARPKTTSRCPVVQSTGVGGLGVLLVRRGKHDRGVQVDHRDPGQLPPPTSATGTRSPPCSPGPAAPPRPSRAPATPWMWRPPARSPAGPGGVGPGSR